MLFKQFSSRLHNYSGKKYTWYHMTLQGTVDLHDNFMRFAKWLGEIIHRNPSLNSLNTRAVGFRIKILDSEDFQMSSKI